MMVELAIISTLAVLSHVTLVAIEAAFAQADREVLQSRSKEGSATAAAAVDLLRTDSWLFGTTLVGSQLALVLAGLSVTAILDETGPTVALAVLLVPLLVIGELLARSVGRHHALEVSQITARPIRALEFILAPLGFPAGWALKSFRLDREQTLSREDIVRLLDDEDARLDPEDRELIRRALELNETQVDECMTPLVQVEAISESLPVSEAVEIMLSTGHSRLPVYRDRIDNIVGLVSHRELLYLGPEATTVSELARSVQFVPETKRVADLLREMRREHGHFAVIVDEYGGVVGIVTIEDLVEEVVGEIRDERDTEEPAIRKLSEREWRIPAQTEIYEIEEVTGIELPEGDYETIAGLVLAAIGRIPETGEIIRIRRMVFRIEQASDRAIQSVHLSVPRDLLPKPRLPDS